MSKETALVRDIQIALQNDADATLWRNNVGTGWQGEVKRIPKQKAILIKNPRLITFGVGGEGASDLVGLTVVEVTPDMIGEKIAVFTSVECKTLTGRMLLRQKDWANVMGRAGALYVKAQHCRDVLEMLEIIRSR